MSQKWKANCPSNRITSHGQDWKNEREKAEELVANLPPTLIAEARVKRSMPETSTLTFTYHYSNGTGESAQ